MVLTQQLGKGLLRAVEGDAVAKEAVEVTVFAGEDDRAARAADGVAHVAALKEHAFARQTIHVRRLVDLRAVRADSMCGVIVCENKDNVRAVCCHCWESQQ